MNSTRLQSSWSHIDHIMGERDKPHSYRHEPSAPSETTHTWLWWWGAWWSGWWKGAARRAGGGRRQPRRGGGGSPWWRGAAAALGPSSSLEMVVVWRRFSTPRRLPGRRKIRGMGLLPRPRVSSLIWTLGFPSPPFRVPPKQAYRPRPNSDWAGLVLKIFVWKIVTTFFLIWFPLDAIFEGQTDNLRKKFSDFRKVPIWLQQGFLCPILIIPTH